MGRRERFTNGGNGNGRDASGRFAPGCAPGPGNPHAASVAEFRSAILAAVTLNDIRDLVRVLVKRGKDGDIAACREILDRVVGKATASVEVSGPRTPGPQDILDHLRSLGAKCLPGAPPLPEPPW